MTQTQLENKLATARDARDELSRLQGLADSLPGLEREQKQDELTARADGQLELTRQRVSATLASEAKMQANIREAVTNILASIQEVVRVVKHSQANIKAASGELGRGVQARVGIEYRDKLSTPHHAANTRAMVDLATAQQKLWARLWRQCGGSNPSLIAMRGSDNRLALDLLALIVRHSGVMILYDPDNPDHFSPFGWR